MAQEDQSLRNNYLKTLTDKSLKEMREKDEENREKFKKIFKERGYISSKYGKDVQLAAFLIVQHMPKEEHLFMKKYLSLMKEDLDNINTLNYAQLVDRVRIYEGKKQLYGTQFELVEGREGVYKVKEIYDFKRVNERREKIGLGKLEEYVEELVKERDIKITL